MCLDVGVLVCLRRISAHRPLPFPEYLFQMCVCVVLQEAVIEIEVIERNPPPKLADEFDHKDWVSGVHISTQ